MRDVLVAICFSSKCKIPKEWRREIYYAQKHCMFPSDKVTIDGEKMKFKSGMDIDSLIDYVKHIDKSCKPKKKKAPTKKKRVKK
jgi:hypothetical protein